MTIPVYPLIDCNNQPVTNIDPNTYPPIESENRPVVDTDQAAFYLGTVPGTLRTWSCYQNGPIKPVKVGRLLKWRVSDIKLALGLEQK